MNKYELLQYLQQSLDDCIEARRDLTKHPIPWWAFNSKIEAYRHCIKMANELQDLAR